MPHSRGVYCLHWWEYSAVSAAITSCIFLRFILDYAHCCFQLRKGVHVDAIVFVLMLALVAVVVAVALALALVVALVVVLGNGCYDLVMSIPSMAASSSCSFDLLVLMLVLVGNARL